MTEKRFTLEMQYWKNLPNGREIVDNLTGEKGISIDELCRIASALHCKCEELESVLEVYEDSLNKLEKENKELRSDRDYWKTLAQSLARTNENVELKDEHLAWKRVDVE